MDTKFNNWLVTFVNEKKLDMSEFVTAGDGTHLQAGDVFSAIMSTGAAEQEKIKTVLVKIDFANGDVMHFIQHLAKSLTKNDKIGV